MRDDTAGNERVDTLFFEQDFEQVELCSKGENSPGGLIEIQCPGTIRKTSHAFKKNTVVPNLRGPSAHPVYFTRCCSAIPVPLYL